jgi:hypothetical protein
MTRLTTDDWVSISDLMGEYCWRVDEGDGDGWAALWTEDAVFTGVLPEPVVGRDQLRMVPINAFNDFGKGQMRHVVANLTCRYGESRDVVNAKLYNYVSVWGGMPAAGNFCMAVCEVVFVRNGQDWLIKRSDARLLTP